MSMTTDDIRAFWDGMSVSQRAYEPLIYSYVLQQDGLVCGLQGIRRSLYKVDLTSVFAGYDKYGGVLATNRAHEVLRKVYVNHDWSSSPGFGLPEGLMSFYFRTTVQKKDLYICVLHTKEDNEELERNRVATVMAPVVDVVKIQSKLGTLEWPDDIVLFRGTKLGCAYFPDYSVNGYLGGFEGRAKILIDGLASPGNASLFEFLEVVNLGEFARSHPELERWFVLTPEQAFNHLGVFRDYLEPKYGLDGYGSTTPEDLMELRKKVYQGWVRQMFPHLFKEEEIEAEVASEEDATEEKSDEVFDEVNLEKCIICDDGDTGAVCAACQHSAGKVLFMYCGCVTLNGGRIWYCSGCK